MIALRLIIVTCFILSPELIWAQNAMESIPTLEPSSTTFKPTFFSKISTYLIVMSIGGIVLASGIWYSIYNRRHQHPYIFLEEAELSASRAEEDGEIEKAIEILKGALHSIQNDPKKFPLNSKGMKETIWFLKRKLQELDDHIFEENE